VETDTSIIMAKSEPKRDMRLSSTLPPCVVIIPLNSETIPVLSEPMAVIIRLIKITIEELN
jgi:hypothetical protein